VEQPAVAHALEKALDGERITDGDALPLHRDVRVF
jgi:hypothetical protein